MTKNRVEFKRVHAKNFRSLDNQGLELLYQTGTTMVGSLENGAGKSTTLVYALYYALFDANYKKGDNKTSLINSRSNKDTVVTVEFNANGSSWKVVRGMKPTIFEIHKDGVKIEDEASLKDYAENLNKVLGMDQKVFCNTVVLGVDKFVPFVSMSAPDRRSYGEQMLDLVFVSRMNELNKDAIKLLNVDMLQLQTKMNSWDGEIKNTTNIINLKKQQAASVSDDLDAQMTTIGNEAKGFGIKKSAIQDDLRFAKEAQATATTASNEAAATRKRQSDLKTARDGFQTRVDQAHKLGQVQLNNITARIDELKASLDSSHLREDCPHCKQRMPEAVLLAARQGIEDQIKKRQDEYKAAEAKNAADVVAYQDGLARASEAFLVASGAVLAIPEGVDESLKIANNEVNKFNTELSVIDSQIRTAIQQLTALKAKKEAAANVIGWADEEARILKLEEDLMFGASDLAAMQVRMKGHEINTVMLKDDGVKAQMVDQYLPFLNERINDRLHKMNMFIRLDLDNEFEINMNAPDRKGQSIHSLSTGQQCRINLAVMLAWRDVAKAAASCDTNILILDEILESMSEAGVADFMEMWHAEANEDLGLYVITQRRQEFTSYFDKAITYKLEDGSTRIVTEE